MMEELFKILTVRKPRMISSGGDGRGLNWMKSFRFFPLY